MNGQMHPSRASEMKIKAIAPWFGGKRNLAPQIIAEFGEHRAYWEPFCGSMAVLMAKEPCRMETVNDLLGDLINLARVVQHRQLGPQLYRRLRRSLCAESLFDEAAERMRQRGWTAAGELDVDRAYDYFLTGWLGRNGMAGTPSYNQGFCRRFTNNGGHAAKRFTSAVESIPAWRTRLRDVTILNDDAFDLLPRIEDAAGAVIYVDSPYVEKGAKYIHDFGREDHARLAAEVRRFRKARVVVSYYNHPLLNELYGGWTKRRLDATKAIGNQGMRDSGGAVKAPEVLLINGPSYAAGPAGLFDIDQRGLEAKAGGPYEQ